MRKGRERRWPGAWAWLVFLLLLPVAGCAAEEGRGTGAGFYFVQITDTHWGVKGSVGLTRKAVAAINKLPVDVEFVVHTGDIFADTIRDEGIVREGLLAMRSLKAPAYYVPGNHDLLEGAAEETQRLYRKHFGALTRKVEVRGVLCLFMNSEVAGDDERAAGQVQREWIAQELRKDERRPVLLFVHRPPVADRLAARTRAEWGEEFHPRWARLFESRHQIKAMVAGHLHRDELHWIGAVPVYVASSLVWFWDRQPSMRLYKYENGRLTYWTIYL